ncbi:MAG: homoserine kinase [Dactylosporangium sp.]|nr:homoserine kinase [Dactylosporangium sp.]
MRKPFVPGPVHVRVPASSANLGPGFDALGLALALHDEITAEVVDGPTRVVIIGQGAGELPADASHLVVRAALAAFDALGVQPPGLALTCRNRIPQARGLGSSSAAIVAGILAARALVPGGTRALDDAAALRLAAAIEGHPDNVAPCLLGGFTIAWTGPDGARAVSTRPAVEVLPTVFVPAERGLTAEARAALPRSVPHADAAFTAGRAALLVHALTRDPDLLYEATEDRLHQAHRAPGMPATARLVARLREAGVAAVVSGAGPSVLCLSPVPASFDAGPGWRVFSIPVDQVGAAVTAGPAPEPAGNQGERAEADPVAAGSAS